MKALGWILIIFGGLCTLGALIVALEGRESNFVGVTFVVLGMYLLHRCKQKQQQRNKQEKWENEN